MRKQEIGEQKQRKSLCVRRSGDVWLWGGAPEAGSVSGENEDKEGEEEQASFKWK